LALGAASSVGLISYQALVAHAYCWLCMIVDTSSIFAALSALMLHRADLASGPTQQDGSTQRATPQRSGLRLWAWCALLVIAPAAALVWHVVRPLPPVPDKIRALYQPGKINVVEFADLECPHCRKLQPILKQVMEAYPDQVHFVRKHVPLPQHPHSERAASAAICAEQLAQIGEAMVERLVSIDLSEQAIAAAATDLGLDPRAFTSCLQAPETHERLEHDLALLREVGFEGLPTTYVGPQRFVGVRTEEAWRDAFEFAARGEGNSGIPGPSYLSALLVLFGLVVWKGREDVLR
jgi:predicted DsbA family dithiol-disulfide isomerase